MSRNNNHAEDFINYIYYAPSNRIPFTNISNVPISLQNNIQSTKKQHIRILSKESEDPVNNNQTNRASAPIQNQDSQQSVVQRSATHTPTVSGSPIQPELENSRPRRKPRTVFTRFQLNRMKEAFAGKPYLTTEERKKLSYDLKITPEQVKVWFQNHRSKLKRQGRLVSGTPSRYETLHTGPILQSTVPNFQNNYITTNTNGHIGYQYPKVSGYGPEASNYEYMNQQLYSQADCVGLHQVYQLQPSQGLQQLQHQNQPPQFLDNSLNHPMYATMNTQANNRAFSMYNNQYVLQYNGGHVPTTNNTHMSEQNNMMMNTFYPNNLNLQPNHGTTLQTVNNQIPNHPNINFQYQNIPTTNQLQSSTDQNPEGDIRINGTHNVPKTQNINQYPQDGNYYKRYPDQGHNG